MDANAAIILIDQFIREIFENEEELSGRIHELTQRGPFSQVLH